MLCDINSNVWKKKHTQVATATTETTESSLKTWKHCTTLEKCHGSSKAQQLIKILKKVNKIFPCSIINEALWCYIDTTTTLLYMKWCDLNEWALNECNCSRVFIKCCCWSGLIVGLQQQGKNNLHNNHTQQVQKHNTRALTLIRAGTELLTFCIILSLYVHVINVPVFWGRAVWVWSWPRVHRVQ